MEAGHRLEAVRRRMGVDLDDLWLAYFGLGGTATPSQMEAYLRARVSFSRIEHDVLAQALNDFSLDRGLNHPAPYAEMSESDGSDR
jgi:hypothetical protein